MFALASGLHAQDFEGKNISQVTIRYVDGKPHSIDTVVLCGFSTSGCVRASCVDAVSMRLRPMVVREACGDRDERPHESNLFDMNAKYGDVVSLDEAIEAFARLGSR